MQTKSRGFTLIELLVVIAIIGILSAVVLASLNTARDKASNVAVKSNLNNVRAQAELYYDTNSLTYAGACASLQITNARVAADSANGSTGTVVCGDSGTGWAMAAQLKNPTTDWYCVDSTGNATTTITTNGSIVDGASSSDTTCN